MVDRTAVSITGPAPTNPACSERDPRRARLSYTVRAIYGAVMVAARNMPTITTTTTAMIGEETQRSSSTIGPTVFVITGCGSHHTAGRHWPGKRAAPALPARLPGQPNPPKPHAPALVSR